jgi:hypothetical protein
MESKNLGNRTSKYQKPNNLKYDLNSHLPSLLNL